MQMSLDTITAGPLNYLHEAVEVLSSGLLLFEEVDARDLNRLLIIPSCHHHMYYECVAHIYGDKLYSGILYAATASIYVWWTTWAVLTVRPPMGMPLMGWTSYGISPYETASFEKTCGITK